MKGNELSQNILTKMISGPVDSNYHENYVFQLTKVEKNYQGKNMAICSMSDGVYESPHMFLMKGDDIKRFNIVQVSNITKKKSNMVFLVVKSYSIVNDKISKLIGNPTLFNSENGINPIEKLQTASKNKKQIKQNTNLSNTMTKNSEDEAFRYFSKFHDIDSVTESFTILVRVVRKTVIDYENKQKEKGKMAKIIFVDMDGVEVEIVIYKKLFEVIEPKFEDGKIYQISRVNPCPNDNRRIGDSPDFIFFFNKQSDIKEINDVYINKKMPHSGRPKLVNIEHIGKFKKFDEIDILCFILDNKPIEEKKNKNGEDMKLKKITIATSCGNKTDIAFFGEKAEEIECMNFEKNDILLIKKAQIKEFNNSKQIGIGKATEIINNMKELSNAFKDEIKQLKKRIQGVEEGEELKTFETSKKRVEYSKDNYTLRELEIIANKLSSDTGTSGYRVKCRLNLNANFEDNCMYAACPDCKKRMNENDGKYECTICKKNLIKPVWTWVVSFKAKDCTSSLFLSCFGVPMDVIANCKAGDFKEKIINNPYEVEILKKKVQLKTFVVVIKPKIEIYQGTQKVKYNVLKIIEVSKNAKSFQEEAETLIQNFTSRFFK